MGKVFALSVFVVSVLGLVPGCNTDTIKEKAEHTISNTGKSIGRGTADFVKGVKEGVDKTLQCKVELSQSLQNLGLRVGKYYITQSKGSRDNILSAYLIFDQDIKRKVSVKVFDKNGLEYGRTSALVEAKSGDANNVDFIFSPRTEIEAKSRFVIE